MAIPPYLEEGSEGPAVNLLLKFLDQKATKETAGPTGIVLDGVLGPTGMRVLHEWQVNNNLSTDGGFGPEGRAAAKDRFGFDFAREAVNLPKEPDGASEAEVTKFVQVDGTELYWADGILNPAPDMDKAVLALYRSRYGN